ncbi:unnamed protein product [Alopecurus aequalis]
MATAAGHCARVAVPSVAFEFGAIAASRVKLACYKWRVSSKKIRELDPSIRYREFLLPRSSFRVQVCRQLSYEGMDERHCSSEKNQPRQPSDDDSALDGDAYLTGLSEKEIERRRKIGAANKGKAPWTKVFRWKSVSVAKTTPGS